MTRFLLTYGGQLSPSLESTAQTVNSFKAVGENGQWSDVFWHWLLNPSHFLENWHEFEIFQFVLIFRHVKHQFCLPFNDFFLFPRPSRGDLTNVFTNQKFFHPFDDFLRDRAVSICVALSAQTTQAMPAGPSGPAQLRTLSRVFEWCDFLRRVGAWVALSCRRQILSLFLSPLTWTTADSFCKFGCSRSKTG